MAVVVKASLEQIKEYKNKNVTTKVGNKKHQVFFRLEVDDFSLVDAVEHANTDKNILMLDYAGSDNYIKSLSLDGKIPYIGVPYEVGMNLSEDDIVSALTEYPSFVTLIIKLPDEYKDLEFLYKMCKEYPRVRFCGGCTFNIEGCRLGCCGVDILESKSIKVNDVDFIHNGCSCAIPTLQFDDVELVVSSKAERTSNTSSRKSQERKVAKFGSLLNRAKVDF